MKKRLMLFCATFGILFSLALSPAALADSVINGEPEVGPPHNAK
ncbi:hypothetical protein NCCP2222_35430 [Sporosarcina sp. NCCP-2222]|nr:hypothetical protein [Sporosarcina sp. NCCP-2222]GKV57596.1 hypothetical protein NCCP2222_35430 [Sporosarcina sp. NCCP-2222]